MDNLHYAKEQFLGLYARYNKWIVIVYKFILAWLIFAYINTELGFMEALNAVYIAPLLGLVCSVLPMIVTAFVAALLIMAQVYELSIFLLAAVGVIFLFMFIVYFQFTHRQAIALLITPILIQYNMPFAIPIIFGLTGNPFVAIPISCGVFLYYLIQQLQPMVDVFKDLELMEMISPLTEFFTELVGNTNMWLLLVTLAVSTMLVASIKILYIPHAWKFAMGVGIVATFIVSFIMGSTFELEVDTVSLLLGNLVGVIIGIVLEFFLYAVEFNQTESITFEDDDYHYYVKAIPKVKIYQSQMELDTKEKKEAENNRGRKNRESNRVTNRQQHNHATRRPICEEAVTDDVMSGDTLQLPEKEIERALRDVVSKQKRTELRRQHEATNHQILHESLQKELDNNK